MSRRDAPVVVLGGSGFVGQRLVARLVDAEYRVRVVTRRREAARALLPLPGVELVEGDALDRRVLATALAGACALVNLVGILNEGARATFVRAHVEQAAQAVEAMKAAGVRRLLQMSAINADPRGPSAYLRSKGEAEAVVAGSGLDWTIFRPSVIFGPADLFLNRFAALLRRFPVMPLPGASARFQPVYVADVAECFVRALELDATIGQRYDLCGPKVYTLAELVAYTGTLIGARRPIVDLPGPLARLQATLLEFAPGTPMSRDNLASMQVDAVSSAPFPAVFGLEPTALEAVAPEWLAPSDARTRYDRYRAASGR